MSEQSPPPKPKPGSLRDRIAAFENKNAGASSTPGPAPAPVPRPTGKPSGLQWKPKVPSPPSSPDPAQVTERKVTAIGSGMSASDAMESIGRGGTLKERMAALQGKGAFGAASPPPMPQKPAEKPKWKPPPVVSPPAAEDPSEFLSRDASRSPPPRGVASPSPETPGSVKPEGDGTDQETEGGDAADPEEEERQRRATIAARMARLGGARVGMAPPLFAPKPVARKPASPPPAPEPKPEEAPVDETNEPEVTSPPKDSLSSSSLLKDETAEPESEPAQEDSESLAPHTRAPASMPVPAGPRRAAPPRKKAYKSAPAAPLPEPPVSEVEPETAAPPVITDKEPVTDVEQLTVSPPDESLITGDIQKEVGTVGKSVEETYDEHLDIKQEIVESMDVVSTEQPREPGDAHEEVKVEEEDVKAADSDIEEEYADEQSIVPKVPEAEIEEDNEAEEVRRKRVAAKLAQMGAFNPFAGPPPVPRRESTEESKVHEGLDVEDEVNVDVEEVGETVPSPPVLSPKEVPVGSFEHVDEPHVETKAGEEAGGVEQLSAPVDRDDEPVLTLGTEEESTRRVLYHPQVDDDGGEGEGRLPSGQSRVNDVEQPGEQDVPEQVAQPASNAYHEENQSDVQENFTGAEQPGTAPGDEIEPEDGVEEDHTNRQAATFGLVAAGLQQEHAKNEEEDVPSVDDEEMAPPRITRPIPPPPVNIASKPSLPPVSPPVSPPLRTSLQVLRADEEDRAASPDIPPRPVPPPGRSVRDVDEAGPLTPPRRSVPPIRRTSVKVTEPYAEVPATPPPIPTSPRPRQRPTSPPIITTVTLQQEPEESEDEGRTAPDAEEPSQESDAQQPGVQEDEESVRRRTIAERMARLGGIRFAAPAMPALSRPAMPPAPPPTSIPPDDSEPEAKEEREAWEPEEEEGEAARKQRIAAKLAGMGGMRFGMLPPTTAVAPPLARRLVSKQEDSESEDAALPVPVPAPPQRAPPTRKPPPAAPIEDEVRQGREQKESVSRGTSDDGVQVEAEESEIEEVHYSDAEAPPLPPPRRFSAVQKSVDALPTPPPRMTSRSPPPGRPPIPSIPATLLNMRPSIPTSSEPSSRKSSADYSSARETPSTVPQGTRPSEIGMRPHSEYVMVEAESDAETEMIPSPPPRRPGRAPPHTVPLPPPPPPSAIEPPEELASSAQWELPSIPQGATEFGDSDLASSGWSEDSTAAAVHVPPPVITSPSGRRRPSSQVPSSSAGGGRRSVDQPQPQLSADELMTIWGKVGVRVVESATALFEKSKRSLVGDGSYAGFVRAVLAQVSGARTGGGSSGDDWGYVIYAQTGGAVQRRVAEIMPGDVIAFWDAKLKGHKGLHAYNQTVGAGESGVFVGVVSEFESKKSKVRVWQANQHVGQQTVENVSYRLEDLKSGHVKVFRVLEA